jgi:predicted nucleic acid-binding protein
VILVDTNIPMYLVGDEHPNKVAARRVLQAAVGRGERLATDAEVLQEILHRYTAIERREAIQPAFDLILTVVDEVLAIDVVDVERAKQITLGGYNLSARDAVHLAVMQRHGIDAIMSFDAGFDVYPGTQRLR